MAVPTVRTAKPSTSAGGTGACTRKRWCSAGSSMSITLVLRSYCAIRLLAYPGTVPDLANLASYRGRMWW
jgi:hypothetical protein